MNQSIVDYIRQHRNTYTREAIDRQLTTAGYNPADITAAWNEVESSTTPPPAPDPTGTATDSTAASIVAQPSKRLRDNPRFWLTFFGYFILSYSLPGIVSTIIFSVIPINSLDILPWVASSGALVTVAIPIIAAITGFVLRKRNRPVGMGLLMGVLVFSIIIPFVFVNIVLGICAVVMVSTGR